MTFLENANSSGETEKTTLKCPAGSVVVAEVPHGDRRVILVSATAVPFEVATPSTWVEKPDHEVPGDERTRFRGR